MAFGRPASASATRARSTPSAEMTVTTVRRVSRPDCTERLREHPTAGVSGMRTLTGAAKFALVGPAPVREAVQQNLDGGLPVGSVQLLADLVDSSGFSRPAWSPSPARAPPCPAPRRPRPRRAYAPPARRGSCGAWRPCANPAPSRPPARPRRRRRRSGDPWRHGPPSRRSHRHPSPSRQPCSPRRCRSTRPWISSVVAMVES